MVLAALAADLFGGRQIGEIRAVAFAGVDHRQPGGPPRGEQRLVRLDGAAELRDVVAEHLAEAARLEEIALHVDDEQRALRGDELERIRLGGDAG